MYRDGFPSWRVWKQAFDFYRRQWPIIPFVLPFCFIPVFTDYLHAELIRQDRSNRGVQKLPSAIVKSAKGFLPLLKVKFQFVVVAVLWSFIPVIGWFKDLDYRLNWAMASNVMVFEDLTGTSARRRCIDLQRSLDRRKALRTLLIIPGMLDVLCLVIMTVGLTFVESSLFFWIPLVLVFVVDLPLSATVNTLFYLSLGKTPEEKPVERTEAAGHDLENFCANCVHLQDATGVCQVASFNVVEYPHLFPAKCNGRYFKEIS